MNLTERDVRGFGSTEALYDFLIFSYLGALLLDPLNVPNSVCLQSKFNQASVKLSQVREYVAMFSTAQHANIMNSNVSEEAIRNTSPQSHFFFYIVLNQIID